MTFRRTGRKTNEPGVLEGRWGESSDELTRALTVTRFSRLQVLKGLAALSAVAVLPSAVGGRSAFAQTSTGTTVTVTGAQPNLAAYMTAWNGAYSGYDRVKELLAIRAMTEYQRKNPTASWDKLVWAADEFKKKYEAEAVRGETPQYRDSKKLVDRMAIGVAVFGALPGAGPLATEAFEKFIKEPIEKQWEPINRFEAIRAQDAYWLELKGKEEEILDGALGFRTDPDFAKAMDAQYGTTTGLSVAEIGTSTNVYGKLVQNLPVDGVPDTVKNKLRGAIKPDGTLSISKDELRGILKEVLGGVEGRLGTLETMMNETMATAKRIEDQQKDILAWIANEEKQKQEQALRQAEAQRHQLVIDGANSIVYLVSTLVGLGGDKALANQISVVGSSAIQIYDAVEKFVDALPELSKLGNLAVGLSGAVMTGNVVGAVMNIVSLFADQGPTPEQMVLEQIGKLQEQVGRMHQQMHERFDRVEKQLDAIYGGINAIFDLVNSRFNQIANDLDGVRRDVDDIQQELARQEAHLSRLGQALHEGLKEGFRQPLVEAINGAIAYKARTGQNMSSAAFADYENKFYSWAVNFAKEENEQPLAGRSYDDDVLSELEGHELEENITYLSNCLQRKAGLPPLSISPLPNAAT